AHAAVAAGIVGLALASRRGPATALAVAVLPSLAHNLDYNRGRGVGSAKGLARIAAQMPARLLIDLVELGSAVRGSVRHGAVVV
ncbi:MAG: hypothetical protein ACRDLO_07445, partial [Solirubrobacterales bacterium]